MVIDKLFTIDSRDTKYIRRPFHHHEHTLDIFWILRRTFSWHNIKKLFDIGYQTHISCWPLSMTNVRLRYVENSMFDNPIIPLSTPWQFHWYSVIISYEVSPLFNNLEQEPTSSDPDSDEEADLVLSLETETGLLTNQHSKGKRKLNWGNEIIDAASDSNWIFHFFPFQFSWHRPLNIVIETFHHYFLWVLHDTVFYDFCNEALLRLDVFVELSQKPHD